MYQWEHWIITAHSFSFNLNISNDLCKCPGITSKCIPIFKKFKMPKSKWMSTDRTIFLYWLSNSFNVSTAIRVYVYFLGDYIQLIRPFFQSDRFFSLSLLQLIYVTFMVLVSPQSDRYLWNDTFLSSSSAIICLISWVKFGSFPIFSSLWSLYAAVDEAAWLFEGLEMKAFVPISWRNNIAHYLLIFYKPFEWMRRR